MVTLKELVKQADEQRPERGKEVAGRYHLIHKLGTGGGGSVWLVRDNKTGQDAALKLLGLFSSENEYAIEMLRNEFSILKDLSHPNICKIYDFGSDDLFGAYFVSEYIYGESLFKATAGAAIEICEGYFVQLMRALAYLHSKGITHFDVKSANVLINEDMQVVLIDFGIAAFEPHKIAKGTFAYMAPETLLNQMPDTRADLYSAGVVLNYILTRKNPFQSASPEEAKEKHLKLPIPVPSAVNPAVPKHIDAIVAKLLQKNPSDRYQSAVEVLRDINLSSTVCYEPEAFDGRFSYIPKGYLIGREKERKAFRDLLNDIKSPRHLRVKGATGTGKSRLLKDFKYTGALNGFEMFDLWDNNEFYLKFVSVGFAKLLLAERPKPALFVIDDFDKLVGLQYAEALINQLEMGLSRKDLKLLLVTSETEQANVSWLDNGLIQELKLENFGKEIVNKYLAAVTGYSRFPKDISDQVFANTGGNPFIVAELTKAMISEGLLVDSYGQWEEITFTDREIDLNKLSVPSSVEEKQIADLRQLPPDLKETVEFLAVLGRPFFADEVKNILSSKTLFELSNRQVIECDLQTGKYDFCRSLFSKVIYNYISEDEREHWHDKIAACLWSSRLQPALIESTEHLYHLSRGSDQTKAMPALKKLIEQQMYEYKNFAAIDNCLYYLKRWNEPSLKLTLAELYNRTGKPDLAIETAQSFISDHATDEKLRAYELAGKACLRKGSFDNAHECFTNGLELAKSGDIPVYRRIQIENLLGETLFFEGKLDEAVKLYEGTAAAVSDLPVEDKIKITNNNLGMCYFQKGEYKKAIAALEKEISILQNSRDKRALARLRFRLAEACRMEHDFSQAIKHMEALIVYSKNSDDLEHLFRGYNGLGNIYNDQGKFDAALSYYERALDIALRLGMGEHTVTCVANLGLIYSEKGDPKRAIEMFDLALAYLEAGKAKIGLMEQQRCRIHFELGELYRSNGRFELARNHLSVAAGLIKTIANKELMTAIEKALSSLAKEILSHSEKV